MFLQVYFVNLAYAVCIGTCFYKSMCIFFDILEENYYTMGPIQMQVKFPKETSTGQRVFEDGVGRSAIPNPEISEKFIDRKFVQLYGGMALTNKVLKSSVFHRHFRVGRYDSRRKCVFLQLSIRNMCNGSKKYFGGRFKVYFI